MPCYFFPIFNLAFPGLRTLDLLAWEAIGHFATSFCKICDLSAGRAPAVVRYWIRPAGPDSPWLFCDISTSVMRALNPQFDLIFCGKRFTTLLLSETLVLWRWHTLPPCWPYKKKVSCFAILIRLYGPRSLDHFELWIVLFDSLVWEDPVFTLSLPPTFSV